MAALTSGYEEGAKLLTLDGFQAEKTVLAAEIMYGHGIAAVDYAGEVQMASDTKGLRVIGRVATGIDNTDDGKTAIIECGVFRYQNDGTYPVTNLMKGQPCYVVDDNTVGTTSTNFVPAGLVHEVDPNDSTLVYVDQRPEALAQALRLAAPLRISKSDNYTVTAAEAFQGNVLFTMATASGASKTFTLPTAVLGARVGFIRGSATAADDVVIDGNASETVLGAATKTNAVDAVSQPLWLRVSVAATSWIEDSPSPGDFASWA